ncbi:GTPase Der [Pseudomonas fluorescens]|nr:GTPase Der [Pseudomonas fluorescens]
MHEKNVELLRDEAQRLLRVEVQLLEQMQSQPGVVTEAHEGEQQTFTSASISKDIEVLRGELAKLEDLEMVLAVVGTMKAGKSTTINAIVGTEVLPNRNRPMTALPTLIRHTPGQVSPVLKFQNSRPINDLMLELHEVITSPAAQKNLHGVKQNADMNELLSLIQQKVSFEDRYEGADLIFWFLKSLNDLVRLSADLNVEFPFSHYDEVHEMPVIEVEFAHLGETSQAGGRLTLLDTPGPNEAGQQHLRKMLSEQLKKASAVLAVLDFTQLKSDADEQVRKELEDIATVAQGRLFTLVNKFDQKDRHGDTEEQVKSFVADTLMHGMLKRSDVFPVSSRWGYLANRAKHEIFLHKVLPDPDKQPWVVDFAEEAFGRRWESKIDDVEEVRNAAEKLWEDSLFSNPLTNVIQTAHARAASYAVDSAASKLIQTAELVEKFLGVRETALAKSSKVLREQISSLRSDVIKIESIKSQTEKDARLTLLDIQERTKEVFKKIKADTEAELLVYFAEGKSKEKAQALARQQHYAEIAQSTSFSGLFGTLNFPRAFGKSKGDVELDFDPENPVMKFDKAEDAENLVKQIEATIKDEISLAERNMLRAMEGILSGFKENFTLKVTSRAQSIIDDLNHRMSAEGFNIEVKIPDVSSLSLSLNATDTLAGMISRQQQVVTRYKRDSGAWGTLCGWFNSNDWGWSSYDVTEKFFQVDINLVKGAVSAAINKIFEGLNETIVESIEKPLKDGVDSFFGTFITTVEQIRGDLLQGIRDQEISQTEQKALSKRLSSLKRHVPAILADSRDLKKDTRTLDNSTEGVLA